MADKTRQCVVIILDSLGIGELPDADRFDDSGADTLGSIANSSSIELPNLAALGLGNIRSERPLTGIPPSSDPLGAYGRLTEVSNGKDSSTGHWELMGLVTEDAFKTFPDGFPDDIVQDFVERASLSGVLGNLATSGTKIIKELGREHIETGKPIIYTSADPVFQIAAHEEVIPIERLYELCEIAFELVTPRGLSRVIARPFIGTWPNYERTYRRRDYSIPPPGTTTLDNLSDAGVVIIGVGKIDSLYAHQGITRSVKTGSNPTGVSETLELIKRGEGDFVYVNLVDFDSKYGHRRDPEGYARALEVFDSSLPELLAAMGPEDLLLLTADHGNDPCFKGTDHTREYVPVLAAGDWVRPVDLGVRTTFADLGATVADFLGYPEASVFGSSFLDDIKG